MESTQRKSSTGTEQKLAGPWAQRGLELPRLLLSASPILGTLPLSPLLHFRAWVAAAIAVEQPLPCSTWQGAMPES